MPEYWIADPDTPSLVIYELQQGQYRPVPAEAGQARSLVLPDLTIDLDAIFKVLAH